MSSIAALMAHLLVQLRAAIGTHLDREKRAPRPTWIGTTLYAPRPDQAAAAKLPVPVWTLLWRRLARLSERFVALHAKWQQNHLPTPRTGPPRHRQARPTQGPRLPRGFGWVNRRIPESAPSTGMLAALVDAPETRRFVSEAPQAGRLLRPLCQALGIRPPAWLALPRRPRKPRQPRPPRPAARPAFAAALRAIPPDRPLQPYVLAAAKAARKTASA